MPRRYTSASPRLVAASIAHNVITDGFSDGWSGSSVELEVMRGLLKPYGIHYVDDMSGRWANPEDPR